MKTSLCLNKWLLCFNVPNLSHGAVEDKIGEAFEAYCEEIFSAQSLLNHMKGQKNDIGIYEKSDISIFESLFKKLGIDYRDVDSIKATTDIEHRGTGGLPKTDLLVTLNMKSKILEIPISIKSTAAPRVAMAEFDVDTIVREIGIEDPVVARLMLKHQEDGSAKNFTYIEKEQLTLGLRKYARKFVRWVITGTPIEVDDSKFPKYIAKFNIEKYDSSVGLIIKDYSLCDIDEYIDKIMRTKSGSVRSGGFGTGLSWTYATGSKGTKIQFKA